VNGTADGAEVARAELREGALALKRSSSMITPVLRRRMARTSRYGLPLNGSLRLCGGRA
jgi:hypothetical protein